jgi:hypothetical protein
MNRTARTVLTILAAAGMASIAAAQQPGTKPPAKPEPPIKINPATPAKPAAPGQPSQQQMDDMMKAYMAASQPGEMHKHLAKGVGTWEGKVKSFEVPNQPPEESTCTSTATSMMDGRFNKLETSGEMGKMGHFEGFGLYGFDNVSQKFQQTWIDNMGTGMMTGTGELSADSKTMTWSLTYNDPMTKKPARFREIERYVDDNHMVLEMYGPGMDGKETKMMEISFTRKMGPSSDATTKPETRPAPKK